MILRSTLKYDDTFLLSLTHWVCGSLKLPLRQIQTITYRQPHGRYGLTGVCKWYGTQIVVRVGERNRYPHFDSVGYRNIYGKGLPREVEGEVRCTLVDEIEAIVAIAAHELSHAHSHYVGDKTRTGGGGGGSEKYTEVQAYRVLDLFHELRANLVPTWYAGITTFDPVLLPVVSVPDMQPCPVPAPERIAAKRGPKRDLIKRRYEAAQRKLEEWQARLKRATNKVKAYDRKVKRYEKTILERFGNQ